LGLFFSDMMNSAMCNLNGSNCNIMGINVQSVTAHHEWTDA
jgi:hypothetical protein